MLIGCLSTAEQHLLKTYLNLKYCHNFLTAIAKKVKSKKETNCYISSHLYQYWLLALDLPESFQRIK